MSDTPKLADECKKLLDNGHMIVLYRSALGSYTAMSFAEGNHPDYCAFDADADDFEPSQALYRLTEKVFGNIV